MTAGELIRSARKAAGITQRELAKRMGLSPQTVAQWENNLRNPKMETLEKIAQALEIDVEALYSNREKEISLWSNVAGWKNAFDYMGYTFSDDEKEIFRSFSKLNSNGKQEAVKRVKELTLIPQYQKSPSEA